MFKKSQRQATPFLMLQIKCCENYVDGFDEPFMAIITADLLSIKINISIFKFLE